MRLLALEDVQTSVGTIRAGVRFEADAKTAAALLKSGKAVAGDAPPPPWDRLKWSGADAVIIAGGDSLTPAQCEAVQVWRAREAETLRRVVVVNTTYQRAPWADVLYACDAPWWRKYHKEVVAEFRGELWTQDLLAEREFGVNRIESMRLPGLGKRPGLIHQGGNGGYQAVNLAYQAGAARIVLLGFDMHGTHWHGKYTNGLPNTAPHLFKQWIENFEQLAVDLRAEGVTVLNCTPESRLKCFPTADLMGVLT